MSLINNFSNDDLPFAQPHTTITAKLEEKQPFSSSAFSKIGIQIFIKDMQSLKSVVECLVHRRNEHTLYGLQLSRVWITVNLLNATHSNSKNFIIDANDFFNNLNSLPECTICLSWCTKNTNGQQYTQTHMSEMQSIVETYIYMRKDKSSISNRNRINKISINRSMHHQQKRSTKKSKSKHKSSLSFGSSRTSKKSYSKRKKSLTSISKEYSMISDTAQTCASVYIGNGDNTGGGHERSFCFYVKANHLLTGDSWVFLHHLLSKFPKAGVVFGGREGISIMQFKWLSAHFPVDHSFYTFEKSDVQTDISLDLLHRLVESTRCPLWTGELAANRPPMYAFFLFSFFYF